MMIFNLRENRGLFDFLTIKTAWLVVSSKFVKILGPKR